MADDVNKNIDQGRDAANAAADKAAENARSFNERAAGAAKTAADGLREGAEKAQSAFQERVAEPARRAGEAMKASGQKLAEGGSTIGMRMIDQAEQNAREAFSAMREAAQAKDLSEVMRIQGDYLREQGTRSMSQAREIGELIAQFGRDAVAPLRGGQG
jgi:hypothetical protein